MHLLSRCSALGPGPGSLPRRFASSSRRNLKFKLANVAVCPIRTAFGPLRHCMALGAPEVLRRGVGAPLAGLKKKSKRGGETKKKILGRYHNFLGIPNRT